MYSFKKDATKLVEGDYFPKPSLLEYNRRQINSTMRKTRVQAYASSASAPMVLRGPYTRPVVSFCSPLIGERDSSVCQRLSFAKGLDFRLSVDKASTVTSDRDPPGFSPQGEGGTPEGDNSYSPEFRKILQSLKKKMKLYEAAKVLAESNPTTQTTKEPSQTPSTNYEMRC